MVKGPGQGAVTGGRAQGRDRHRSGAGAKAEPNTRTATKPRDGFDERNNLCKTKQLDKRELALTIIGLTNVSALIGL
jgi:hypothetical protein